jgi:hypothetical protein
MPRNGSGVYTLPAGNPVVAFTTITTAWANPTMADIGTELTNSLDRQGRGGMLAPFRIFDGTISQPGLGFLNEVGLGLWRESSALMHIVNSGVNVISIHPDKATFPVTVEVRDDTQYRQTGYKNWQVSNQDGFFSIAPSTAVDGSTWDYTKAMTINPDTGVVSFPVVPGQGYVRITGDTMTGNLGIKRDPANFALEVAGRAWIQDAIQPTLYLGDTLTDSGVFEYNPSTKVARIGADGAGTSVILKTQSVDRVWVDTSGNVGIGVVPTSLLGDFPLQLPTLKGVLSFSLSCNLAYYSGGWRSPYTSSQAGYLITSGTGGMEIYTAPPNAGAPDSAVSAVQAMIIGSSGNVGIGVAPSYKLHVSSATEDGMQVTDGTRVFAAINSAAAGGVVLGAYSNHPLLITTNNTERMRIDATGNVGIGVPPATKLHIQLAASSAARVSSSDPVSPLFSSLLTGFVDWAFGTLSGSGDFVFAPNPTDYSAAALASATKFRVTGIGNVGIGIAPAYRLDVVGAAGNGVPALRVLPDNNAGIQFVVQRATDGGGTIEMGTVDAHNLRLIVTNTPRVTVDTSGNVGIGVVPAAWSAALRALEVGVAGSALYSVPSNFETGINSNIVYDGANKYANTGFASQYQQYLGEHLFKTAPSGTAGAAATLTTRMSITADGRILAPAIHNNAGGASGTTPMLASGTYTPTSTPLTNINSASFTRASYTRVGNVVTVAGFAQVTATGAGAYEFDVTLPITCTADPTPTLGGVASNGTTGSACKVEASAGNPTTHARFTGTAASNIATLYNYTYQYLAAP